MVSWELVTSELPRHRHHGTQTCGREGKTSVLLRQVGLIADSTDERADLEHMLGFPTRSVKFNVGFPVVEPLQGSSDLNARFPRVAPLRRLPWAMLFNPFGVFVLRKPIAFGETWNYWDSREFSYESDQICWCEFLPSRVAIFPAIDYSPQTLVENPLQTEKLH